MTPSENRDTTGWDQLEVMFRELVERTPERVRVSVVLIVVGFLGRRLTRGEPSLRSMFALAYSIGIVLLIAWFAELFVLPLVRKQQVVEQWGILIENGQDRGSEFVERSRQLIVDTRAPNITMEDQDVAPGVLRGVLGVTRPFLVVSNDTNVNLKLFRMYLNARDYGNNLQISWYVVQTPSLWRTVLSLSLFVPFLNILVLPLYIFVRLPGAREAGLLDLDLFDLQDLTAYVTNAHHCVLEAVDKVLLDLSQDPSKIERKSRGFLGIS